MIKIIKKLSNYKALAYLGDKIIVSRMNKLYHADYDLGNLKFICDVGKMSLFYKIAGKFRVLQRLFRMELGPAVTINKETILIFNKNIIYKVNILTNEISEENIEKLSHKPLSLMVSSLVKSKGIVYFGEYSSNPNLLPVKIYKRDVEGVWNIVYVFPYGAINHIHNIIQDAHNNKIYVLTGDVDTASCIWIFNDELTTCENKISFGQATRACWIHFFKDRVFFATDRQDEHNYFSEIILGTAPKILNLFPIVGSSIYYTKRSDERLLFSTTVENLVNKKNNLKTYLSLKRGPGILSNESCIYEGNIEVGFRILFSAKKDFLPYQLFQLGSINFPTGILANEGYIHFYCNALRGYDGVTVSAKYDRINN
jgi:hypothetical protein